jgi:3-hydroxymyristoyl/3-hydroxydecanoyl-(acyl carrier protein) dehydratase
MRAGVRPATLSADDPIDALDGAPLRLLAEPEDWPGLRRAAVSAFGFGGSNAHVVVDAAVVDAAPSLPAGPAAAVRSPRPGGPVAISAIGARVAGGRDAEDFRQAVLGGQPRPAECPAIDVALDGLRFPPRDLAGAHAQQVLVLEAAREAAGRVSLPRERTVVIVGMGVDPEGARYPALRRADPDSAAVPLTAAAVLGAMPNLVANRINVQLDLAGPSYTVSAEEASGLVALELAGHALRAGEADAALVGAVDLSCEPVHRAAVAALGRDRRPGDAAVVLVLERLADARRLGHPVLAVLDDEPGGEPPEGDGRAPALVVGDGDGDGDGAGNGSVRLDPAELFGVAHAAHGLVAVAVAATAVRHGVVPGIGHPAVPVSGDLTALAVVEPLGGSRAGVRLRPGDAVPHDPGPPDAGTRDAEAQGTGSRDAGTRDAEAQGTGSRGTAAAAQAATTGQMLRLPAHPAPLRLPGLEPPVAEPGHELPDVRVADSSAATMPRAPKLPPVLTALVPDQAGSLAQAATRGQPGMPSLAGTPAQSRMPEQAGTPVPAETPVPPAAGFVARQFERVSTLHQDFLAQQAEVHARFLDSRRQVAATLARLATPTGSAGSVSWAGVLQRQLPPGEPRDGASAAPVTSGPVVSCRSPARPGPKFDRGQLERLAVGRISELFGPRFAAQDGLVRQTRLPAPPLLLVDRVTGIDAEPGSMGTGTIWTETDVRLDSWYLDATGRMPAGLLVEAGQADLLLISWLGIDLLGHGDRVYRLLGCELTYHGSPAVPGETLRFDIHVDGHAEHSGVRLFFFHYDCHVGAGLRMSVRGGQAGFFTDGELDRTGGVQWDPTQVPPGSQPVAGPLVRLTERRFGHDAVRAFAEGRPADCFGAGWEATRAHVRSPRTGAGRMLLLGAVTDVDPAGGPWQRGYLRAETAVTAGDWFFAGHFTNDPCMPGTLMFEGGLQAMAFYLAALGYTVDRDGWRFEPLPEHPCLLRCRGQVTPASRQVVYEVFVSGLTVDPYPVLYADVLGTVDGVKAFHARRAALRLVPDWPLDHWRQLGPPATQLTGQPTPLPEIGLRDLAEDRRAVVAGGVRQDYAALLACAWGRPTQAIGPDYARFDGPRRAPRLPGPPYHFMTRLTGLDGALGSLQAGTAVTAEYDVPADAWYFEQNGTPSMPFAVLMEIVLQPCGWLAMYAGSVLGSETDLLFRNLDGTGTVLREIPPGAGTLCTHVTLRSIAAFDDVIIETFTAECTLASGPAAGERVFEAETVFGFFPKEAFTRQPGLPASAAEQARLAEPGDGVVDLRTHPARHRGGAWLAGPMLLMVDRVTGYRPDGGRAGLGWLRAEKDIDPGEWFFKAHFFQDPVQPGSLGVQAMCQLLQWYLTESGTVADLPHPRFEPIMTGHPLTWRFRGQIVPTDRRVWVEMEIVDLGADQHGRYAVAEGWLWVDGRRIYHVRDLGMRAQ